jgi:uracil-DNA glycosylase
MYTPQLFKDLLSDEWKQFIGEQEFDNLYWNTLCDKLNSVKGKIYPKKEEIFNALNYCPPNRVKVVIIGQDPYHNGSAHGFSFSAKNGLIPKSLQNIFKELRDEYNSFSSPPNGNLEQWEDEGVLLLNSVLTVTEGTPKSHLKFGWLNFVSKIIECLDTNRTVLFLAWGADAKKLCSSIIKNNKILFAGHPSPINTGNPFVGCNHFKQVNEILMANGHFPIRWNCLLQHRSNIPRDTSIDRSNLT